MIGTESFRDERVEPAMGRRCAPVAAVAFDLFNTLKEPIDRAAFRSLRVATARALGVDSDDLVRG